MAPPNEKAGEAQRGIAREHLDEQLVHEVEVRRAGHLARDGRRGPVRRMVERVHGEALGERLDVAEPVLPRSHAAVKEHDVGSGTTPVHGHAGRLVGRHSSSGTRVKIHGFPFFNARPLARPMLRYPSGTP
jgi:hypothetical protein